MSEFFKNLKVGDVVTFGFGRKYVGAKQYYKGALKKITPAGWLVFGCDLGDGIACETTYYREGVKRSNDEHTITEYDQKFWDLQDLKAKRRAIIVEIQEFFASSKKTSALSTDQLLTIQKIIKGE
jgi:hypothetical protein